MQDNRDIRIAVRTMPVSRTAAEENSARHVEAPSQSLDEDMRRLIGYGVELLCMNWHFTPRDERSSSVPINHIIDGRLGLDVRIEGPGQQLQ